MAEAQNRDNSSAGSAIQPGVKPQAAAQSRGRSVTLPPFTPQQARVRGGKKDLFFILVYLTLIATIGLQFAIMAWAFVF